MMSQLLSHTPHNTFLDTLPAPTCIVGQQSNPPKDPVVNVITDVNQASVLCYGNLTEFSCTTGGGLGRLKRGGGTSVGAIMRKESLARPPQLYFDQVTGVLNNFHYAVWFDGHRNKICPIERG